MTVDQVVTLLVRYGLVMLFFPFSALDKTLNFKGAVKQAEEVFHSPLLAAGLILVGLFVEVITPLGILTGVADRLAAFILAGYCVTTALLFKRFWQPGDFWSPDGKARPLFWDFLKNLSLASGILFIVVGLDGHGWHLFIADPLASSHPYTTALPR